MAESSKSQVKPPKRSIPVRVPGGTPYAESHPVNALLAGVQLDDIPQTLNNLDAQNEIIWASKDNTLDAKTPKTNLRTPKADFILDAKTPKNNNLDAQKFNKPILPSDELVSRKYERARSTARVALRPNTDVLQQIRVWCATRNMDLSRFFEVAGLYFIENLDAQTNSTLDAKTPHDDRRLMMFKTKPTIINLYRAYNPKNQWKINDDKVACELNDTDIRLIELGIIQTQFNARFKRVNSFGYYLTEIQNWRDNAPGEEMLDFLLKHHREQWQKATGQKLQDNSAKSQ